jgi:hypothetical protein
METQEQIQPVLTGYLTQSELARQIKRSERTLTTWRAKRIGPAVTYVGKTPHYRVEAVREWLRAREAKPMGSGKGRGARVRQ